MSGLHKHHAVLFEGDRGAALREAEAYVSGVLGIAIKQNPDVSIDHLERLTVEYARTLKERASQRPFGDALAFIITCDSILHEAQNALLKLLEEPADRTHFIFILPSSELLLPTVRSRLFIAGRVEQAVTNWDDAENFVKAGPAERQRIIAPLVKDKDRPGAQSLVRMLERYFHQNGVGTHARQLADIAFVERYLGNRSSSVKMLLEHLAAVL